MTHGSEEDEAAAAARWLDQLDAAAAQWQDGQWLRAVIAAGTSWTALAAALGTTPEEAERRFGDG